MLCRRDLVHQQQLQLGACALRRDRDRELHGQRAGREWEPVSRGRSPAQRRLLSSFGQLRHADGGPSILVRAHEPERRAASIRADPASAGVCRALYRVGVCAHALGAQRAAVLLRAHPAASAPWCLGGSQSMLGAGGCVVLGVALSSRHCAALAVRRLQGRRPLCPCPRRRGLAPCLARVLRDFGVTRRAACANGSRDPCCRCGCQCGLAVPRGVFSVLCSGGLRAALSARVRRHHRHLPHLATAAADCCCRRNRSADVADRTKARTHGVRTGLGHCVDFWSRGGQCRGDVFLGRARVDRHDWLRDRRSAAFCRAGVALPAPRLFALRSVLSRAPRPLARVERRQRPRRSSR
eukprot:Amastigsp_a843087_141.p2 type:complete len:352 gc:universal Amastigsp_a843087_141:251-1306(+)